MTSPAISIHVSLKIWPVIRSQDTKHKTNKNTSEYIYRYELYRHI